MDSFLTSLSLVHIIVHVKYDGNRRQHLTEAEKLKIVEMFKKGKKKIDIAKMFSVNRCIITKIIKRFDEYGTVKTVPRIGRRRKTTEKLDRRITSRIHFILLLTLKINWVWETLIAGQLVVV